MSGIERGILFNTSMVRAILEDRKTITRRPVTFTEGNHYGVSRECYDKSGYDVLDGIAIRKEPFDSAKKIMDFLRCPYGVKGDRLYVRETWCLFDHDYHTNEPLYLYRADEDQEMIQVMKEDGLIWKPSIHMPKSAARIWLEITNVQIERVQDLNDEDAKAEGFPLVGWIEKLPMPAGFAGAWNAAYPGSWERNDWVWVIDFKRIYPGYDFMIQGRG